jgi:TPR repeat protein
MQRWRWCAGILLSALATSAVQAQQDVAVVAGIEAARQGDFVAAAKMLQPLAKEGSGQAQFNLGLLYHSGMGVAQDEAAALRLYEMAAGNGYPLAQEYLAVAYAEGWFGLNKDAAKARYWSDAAAGSGR